MLSTCSCSYIYIWFSVSVEEKLQDSWALLVSFIIKIEQGKTRIDDEIITSIMRGHTHEQHRTCISNKKWKNASWDMLQVARLNGRRYNREKMIKHKQKKKKNLAEIIFNKPTHTQTALSICSFYVQSFSIIHNAFKLFG